MGEEDKLPWIKLTNYKDEYRLCNGMWEYNKEAPQLHEMKHGYFILEWEAKKLFELKESNRLLWEIISSHWARDDLRKEFESLNSKQKNKKRRISDEW